MDGSLPVVLSLVLDTMPADILLEELNRPIRIVGTGKGKEADAVPSLTAHLTRRELKHELIHRLAPPAWLLPIATPRAGGVHCFHHFTAPTTSYFGASATRGSSAGISSPAAQ